MIIWPRTATILLCARPRGPASVGRRRGSRTSTAELCRRAVARSNDGVRSYPVRICHGHNHERHDGERMTGRRAKVRSIQLGTRLCVRAHLRLPVESTVGFPRR